MAEKTKIDQQKVLEEFRKLATNEKDLFPCTEDEFLLKFLHMCNFDCKKSKQLLLNYYKLKFDHAQLYTNFSPSAPNMLAIWEADFLIEIPQLDHLNRKVVAMCLGKWNPNISSFNDLFIALHMCFEVVIESLETGINQIVLLLDVSGIGLQHAKQLTPSNVKKLIALIERSLPANFQEFHIINENTLFKTIYGLIKPFLSMSERITFHGKNIQSLHQRVNPNILPKEFGGPQQSISSKQMTKKLMEYEDYLQKVNSFGYKV